LLRGPPSPVFKNWPEGSRCGFTIGCGEGDARLSARGSSASSKPPFASLGCQETTLQAAIRSAPRVMPRHCLSWASRWLPMGVKGPRGLKEAKPRNSVIGFGSRGVCRSEDRLLNLGRNCKSVSRSSHAKGLRCRACADLRRSCTTDEVFFCDQSQDRQGAWYRYSRQAPRTRRRSE
jgi:hypothetical protein